MRKRLTPDVVAKAKPRATPYEISDADLKGFLLRVQPSGTKSFVVTWGRGKRRTLGRHPVMTVAGARAAALGALSESAQHGAPLVVIEANKPAEDRPITLGDFICEHFAPWAMAHQKAGQATVDALKACFGHLYGRELRSLSAFDVERFKSRRLKEGRKPATVNRDLDRIRSVYSRAVEWGFLGVHPLKAVKRAKGVDNSRVRYLSADEGKRLRGALQEREETRRASRERHNEWHAARGSAGHPQWPTNGFTDHLAPMVLIALNTGLRRGELLGLTWENVNLASKLLTVAAGVAKSRKARHIPLNAEALDVLARWKAQGVGRGLVFPGPGGVRMTHINTSWEGIVDDAKLLDFRFHDLRHDFASKLVMRGVDLNTVRELLGHADLKMTLRYAHLAPERLAAAVEKLGAA